MLDDSLFLVEEISGSGFQPSSSTVGELGDDTAPTPASQDPSMFRTTFHREARRLKFKDPADSNVAYAQEAAGEMVRTSDGALAAKQVRTESLHAH